MLFEIQSYTETGKDRKRDLSSAGSLPKWPQQPELDKPEEARP